MRLITVTLWAITLFVVSCVNDGDSAKPELTVSFRFQAPIPDSLFTELFSTAKLKVTAKDIADINKDCQINPTAKEITCKAPIPLGKNRTFEVFVYSKSNTLAYYGKKDNEEIKSTSNDFEITLFRLASDVTIKGVISDSLLTSVKVADWVWTNDARGGGSQGTLTTQGDTLTIGPVNHVHFVNKAQTYGAGKYAFKFKGTNFKFAWRISPMDPAKGTALILQKAPGESFALIHVGWEGFSYGWHNASNQFRNTVAVTPSSNEWHLVEITDNGTTLVIKLDGAALDLFSTPNKSAGEFLSDVGTGFIGIGNNDQNAIRFQGIQVSN